MIQSVIARAGLLPHVPVGRPHAALRTRPLASPLRRDLEPIDKLADDTTQTDD